MKVYVLHYCDYDESEVRGVYTEEAMKKELAMYVEWGRERERVMITDQEARIEELKARRKELGQKDRRLQEKQEQLEADGAHNARKMLKSERKEIMRQMDQLAMSIRNQEYGLEKMKSLTDEQIAEREMERAHLYFEEFYVIGMME